ncbi:AsmA family protein [Candidatus Omnitrophota bacterium]
MKKFFIVVIFIFIIIAIGLFVFILTFDVNQYTHLLVEKIEGATQKDVEIGNISLDVLPNLALRVNGFSMKDKDKTWEDSLLNVASMEARIKLLPLIKKDIQIEHLHVSGLNITISEDSIKLPRKAVKTDEDNVDIGLATAGALKFLVKSVSILDSSIDYAGYLGDLSGKPVDIKMDIIEATLKNISFYGPVHIEARLSAFGRGAENIRLKGILYPQLKTKKPYIKNLNLTLDLARFDLHDALTAVGKIDIAQKVFGKEIKGELVISSERIYMGVKELFNSDIRIILSGGSTDALPIKDGLKNIELALEANKGNVAIQNFTGIVAGGSLSLSGYIKNVFSRQDLDLDIKLRDINVGRLLPDVAPFKPSFDGILNMDVHSSSRGLEKEEMLETLIVEGALQLDEAKLKNMNILVAAFEKLNMLPGLVGRLKSNLPEHYRGLLSQNHTLFSPLSTDFNIKNGKLFFQDALIASDGFYLECSGYLDTEKNLSVHSDLFIPEDLSKAFTLVVRELKYLQNAQAMITMPLDIGGKFPAIAVKPDYDYVIRKLAVSKGQELIEDIFRKSMPSEKKDETGDRRQSPAEELLKDIFGTREPAKTKEGSETEPAPSKEEQETQKAPEEAASEPVEREPVKPAEVIMRTIFDIITAPRDTESE